MTDERQEKWAREALSGVTMRPAEQALRRRVLDTARSEWDRRVWEGRQLWRTARDMTLAVAAVLVVAFIVGDIDERLTAAVRPRPTWATQRESRPPAEPEWARGIGATAQWRSRMLAAAARPRSGALDRRRILLNKLVRNGG